MIIWIFPQTYNFDILEDHGFNSAQFEKFMYRPEDDLGLIYVGY